MSLYITCLAEGLSGVPGHEDLGVGVRGRVRHPDYILWMGWRAVRIDSHDTPADASRPQRAWRNSSRLTLSPNVIRLCAPLQRARQWSLARGMPCFCTISSGSQQSSKSSENLREAWLCVYFVSGEFRLALMSCRLKKSTQFLKKKSVSPSPRALPRTPRIDPQRVQRHAERA